MAVLRFQRSRKFIRCHWVLLPNGLSASQPHSGQASQLFFLPRLPIVSGSRFLRGISRSEADSPCLIAEFWFNERLLTGDNKKNLCRVQFSFPRGLTLEHRNQVINDGTDLCRKMAVSRIDRMDRICNRACIRQSIDKLTIRQRFGDDEDRKNGNTKNG
ncbi:hypothetical protein SAMN05216308_11929 [Nitrosospira sp. Nsp13]|nr:hypothetical protein [Nitrosospira sp. Nsp13]SCY57536.1 hypothetical protein SAMN05216308_11929 [Nitrosospira sp. Nsp13]